MSPLIGHNQPPDDQSAFQAQLEERNEDLVARRNALLDAATRVPKEIDDETAEKAAHFIKQLTAHEKEADKARKAEKEPHLERGRWVDGFFKGRVTVGIPEVKAEVTRRLTAYQKQKADEERKRREEEERRQREEAERIRREAEEQARAAQTDEDLDKAIEADERARQAQLEAERAKRASEANAADLSRQHTSAGAVASLRTTVKCTSYALPELDLEALRGYFAHADIEKAIRSFIRAGGRQLRGANIEEVQETRVA